MKRTIVCSVAIGFAAAARLGAQEVKLREEKPGLAALAKVTFEVAKSTAAAKVPAGKLVTAELEKEDGKNYSLAYKTDGKRGVDEVNVDAMTGRVVGVEHEKSEPRPEGGDAPKKAVKPPAGRGGL